MVFCNKCKYYWSGMTKFGRFPERCGSPNNYKDGHIAPKSVLVASPGELNINNDCPHYQKRGKWWKS